jgi:hypothetical protein
MDVSLPPSSFLMTILVFLCFLLLIFPATTECQKTGSTRHYQFDVSLCNSQFLKTKKSCTPPLQQSLELKFVNHI